MTLELGLWLTITELAARKGVSKPAISMRVKALETAGKLQSRPGSGRAKLVNLAEYDRAVGETGDAAHEQAVWTKKATEGTGPEGLASREAATRDKQYSADLKFLELQERLGAMVPVSALEARAVTAGAEIVRLIDRLPSRADAFAAAVTKGGVQAVRTMLLQLNDELGAAITAEMTALANAFPPSRSSQEPD